MPESNEQQNQPATFPYHVHTYLRQFIQAADQKAAFTLAASSAVLGFLINRFSGNHCLHSICFWVFGGLAALSLVIAAGLAALSVRPRQNDIEDSGLVAWIGILKKHDANAYIKSVKGADHAEEIMTHCYKLSSILRTKYKLLKCSVDLFMVGSAIAILFLVIAMLEK
jgi:hypothetical protein